MWRVLCAGHHGAASGSNPLTEKYLHIPGPQRRQSHRDFDVSQIARKVILENHFSSLRGGSCCVSTSRPCALYFQKLLRDVRHTALSTFLPGWASSKRLKNPLCGGCRRGAVDPAGRAGLHRAGTIFYAPPVQIPLFCFNSFSQP